jgi:predicted permease
MNPEFAFVGPGFFTSMGTKLLAGRDFEERDAAGGQKVAIINASFAKKWFPNESPLGRKVAWGRGTPDHTIVGVVADMRQRNLREELGPMYYYPFLQNENPGQFAFYVRASGDMTQLSNLVRREITKVSATIPIYDMRSMESQVDQILNVERAVATMSGFFGLLAATLAAVGLYGVMAYTVTRRTREIGIRMALGAERSYVLWLVLREVLLMLAIGVGFGLPTALLLGRYVESQVYGVSPHDVITLAVSVVALAVIAMLAGFVPARRAATVDPIRALRYE